MKKGTLVAIGALLALGGFVAVVVAGGTKVPDGPVPIVWDREPCAHCRMAVGDPRHAVQLIETNGIVSSFDDVGCAIMFIRQQTPEVHRLWFHGEGDTWLGVDQVGFIPAEVTPMGSGLIAVDWRAAGARGFEAVARDYRPPSSSAPAPDGAP